MKKIYWLYVLIIGLIAFGTYETIRGNKLDKELRKTKVDLAEAEDKLQSVHDKLTDLQSRASELQDAISDLYHNRSSNDIEDAEDEADNLTNDINEAEDETNQ